MSATLAENATPGTDRHRRPPRRGDHVRIPALLEPLTRGLAGKKLLLVTAPAGYGKTALLHQLWRDFEASGDIRLWLSLARSDTDPLRFAASLNAACAAAGDALPAPADGQSPDHIGTSARQFVAYLAERLASDRRVVFFIDEYHQVQGDKTDALMAQLIADAPDNLRIVLASRSTPSIGAAKLRLEDALIECKREDLAFGEVETLELFDDRIDRFSARLFAERTEGWPAGLQMAKLRIAELGFPDNPIRYFDGALDNVYAYFAEEVFNRLPQDFQEFLCETSILEEFDADIANETLLRGDADELIGSTDRMSAFLTPVDPEHKRFRHHSLFADFLRRRLVATRGSEHAETLHRQAAECFKRRGDYFRALQHAADQGEAGLVSAILVKSQPDLFRLTKDQGAFVELLRRLKQRFPDEISPLAPVLAFSHVKEGKLDQAKAELDSVRSIHEGAEMKDLTGPGAKEYVEFKTADAAYQVYADGEDCDAVIAELEGPAFFTFSADPSFRGGVNNVLGKFEMRRGRLDKAEQCFARALNYFSENDAWYSLVHIRLHLGWIAFMQLKTSDAKAHFDEAERLQKTYLGRHDHLSALLDIALGECAYQIGDMEVAAHLADRGRKLLVDGNDYWPEVLEHAYLLSSAAEFASGGYEAAKDIIAQGLGYARERDYKRVETALLAQKILLCAREGRIGEADGVIAKMGSASTALGPAEALGFSWAEKTHLTFALARLEIAKGNASSALERLDPLPLFFDQAGLAWYSMRSSALYALALFADENTAAACERFKRLMLIADEAGLSSLFLQEGELAKELLREAGRRIAKSIHSDGVRKIVVAWLGTADALHDDGGEAEDIPSLTERQSRMLKLVLEGRRRQEIADLTGTTKANVAYHIRNLFELFDVDNVAELTSKAARVGLAGDGKAGESGPVETGADSAAV